MKLILKMLQKAVIVVTVLSLIIGTSLTAYAADVDSVLNDAEWTSYVERSIEIDKTPGLAVVAVKGSDVGLKTWG